MSARGRQGPPPASLTEAAAALFMAVAGIMLPFDVLYAYPGVMMYATPGQAARIFLQLVALSLAVSAALCLCALLVGAAPGGWRRYDTGRAAFVALSLSLALISFSLLQGLLVWSSYFIEYSPDLRRFRLLADFALSVPLGYFLAARLPRRRLESLFAVLRASTALVLVVAAGCAAVLALNPGQAQGRVPEVRVVGGRPSIVLITIDTLSALHLPMYGYERPTAPRLAEFADGATLFLHNYANSNFTTPSVVSILYGYRPWSHRAIQLEGLPLARLSGGSLPALLGSAGYFTASVSTNPKASPRNLRIEDRFAVLADHKICAAANPVYMLGPDLQTAVWISLVWNSLASLAIKAADVIGLCGGGQYDPELAFAEARRILAGAPAERPLFLWIHLYPPHDPYVAPEPFVGTFNPGPEARDRSSTVPPHFFFEATFQLDFPGVLLDRYDEAIRYLDHHVGAFLDHLKKQGRFDDSLIIITADHGESFTKGYAYHGGPKLHEELVRVPLLIKTPSQRRGLVVSAPSEQVDLVPTILEIAGVQASRHGEGVSLVPAMLGRPVDRPVFAMNFEQSPRSGRLDTGTVAMIGGRWKYVHYFGHIRYPHLPSLADELYDLSTDPRETQNEIARRPDVAERMREDIENRLREFGRPVR